MKSLLQTFILLFLALSFHAQNSSLTNKVLVLGIDGCRPDALLAANTPNIDLLWQNGTYSWHALNNEITVSGPGWSAMMTGVWSDKHGVVDNLFAENNYEEFPSFFKLIEDHNPNLETHCVSQWPFIGLLLSANYADSTYYVLDETQYVVDAVTQLLNTVDPDVLFVQFDDVDHAGHNYGFSPEIPEYIASIEEVDTGIGSIMETLKARPTYAEENWLILLSTDHGGIGTGHGGNTFEEENIFFIASGDYIPNVEIVRDSVQGVGDTIVYDYSNTPRIVDVAVTALAHLCVPVAPEWQLDGQIVGASCQEIFTHSTDYQTIKKETLSIFPNPLKMGDSFHFTTFQQLGNAFFQAKLYDVSGKLVLSTPLQSANSPITLPFVIPVGLYILRVSNQKGTVWGTKVLVE